MNAAGGAPLLARSLPDNYLSLVAGSSGVLAGGYVLGGGTMDKALVTPGAQLALGLDYKFNFTWSAGVGYRQHLFFTKVTAYPSYSTFFLRVEYAWGR